MNMKSIIQQIEQGTLDLPDDGLLAQRNAAAKRLQGTGLPSTKMENWKYTSVFAIGQSDFSETGSGELVFQSLVKDVAARLVFVDGVLDETASSLDDLPKGLTIKSLGQAELINHATVRASWQHDFSRQDEGFSLLNSALCSQGMLLSAASGVKLESPVEVIYTGSRSRAIHPRHVIELEAGSEVTLVESYQGASGFSALCNLHTQINLQAGAKLQHISLQQMNKQSFLISRTDVSQAEESRYDATCLDLGAEIARRDVNVDLLGEQASAALYGSYAPSAKQIVDNHSRIRHVATNCSCDEVFRGVLRGKSKSVFNGKVIVEVGADGSDAKQSNANLLLSRDAEAFSKPELQIHADEVTAAHGSTVGELDEQALFYLRARGIAMDDARLMMTEAFCKEVLDHIDHPQVAEKMGELLSEALRNE